VEPGDRVIIETPGGGGFGTKDNVARTSEDISLEKPSGFVLVAVVVLQRIVLWQSKSEEDIHRAPMCCTYFGGEGSK
jgi:N-methylhydantoinase B/oxoprolinase/acetone carboxylase alpha subunit